MKNIEDEKKKLFLLAKEIEIRSSNLGRNLPPLISPEKMKFSSEILANNKQILRKNSRFLNNFNTETNENGNDTIFESFVGDENIYFQNNLKKKNSFNNNFNNILANIANTQEVTDKIDLISCIQEFKSYYPAKYVPKYMNYSNFLCLESPYR